MVNFQPFFFFIDKHQQVNKRVKDRKGQAKFLYSVPYTLKAICHMSF